MTHFAKPVITALLAAPDTNNWIGRRGRAVLQLAIETGLRVSELATLTRDAVAHHARQHTSAHLPHARRQERDPTRAPTPQRCGYYTPASTLPSSRSGAATKTSKPPALLDAEPGSKNARSRERPHPDGKPGRYKPPDALIALLEGL